MSNNDNPPNRLIGCTSPYLLQHAHNPVDWQPWGNNAWSEAKDKNRLVLVSIGYSTCHWCHVMEKESFEDNETAEIMNMGMISIKVDREERPDVDMVYMDACQLMTGKGGWPLNVICLPDGRPVYAGTYFPKPQWQQIIVQLTTQYRSNPEKFEEYAIQLHQEMQKLNQQPKSMELDFSRRNAFEIFEKYSADIDWIEGGKQRTPKFMVPCQFEYALDFHLCTGDESAKEYVQLSLLKMSNGGLYDHLRGGFFRYSTDGKWFAPHFEKMLYDNAQLIRLYSRAYAWLNAENFKEVTQQTIDFCLRELKAPEGGFYSGLDADSEGQEGRFYTFTYNELQSSLTKDELQWITEYSNIQPNGNWEAKLNIIHANKAPLQVLESLKITAEEYHTLKKSVLKKLFKAQEIKERPSLDYKIITSWNGLMLQGLATAYLYTQVDLYRNEANELANWLTNNALANGTVYRINAKGKQHTEGFLDDYAALALGLVTLFKATQDAQWIEKAKYIADIAIELFYKEGTFNYVSKEAESLIVTKSDNTDDVIPSSNAMMAEVLEALFMHYSEPRYFELFKESLNGNAQFLSEYPGWYSAWARLHLMQTCGNAHVAIHNELPFPNHLELAQWPSWITIGKMDTQSPLSWLSNNKKGYFLCSGTHCYEGVRNWEDTSELLEELYGGEH